jgi:hypothetical protein
MYWVFRAPFSAFKRQGLQRELERTADICFLAIPKMNRMKFTTPGFALLTALAVGLLGCRDRAKRVSAPQGTPQDDPPALSLTVGTVGMGLRVGSDGTDKVTLNSDCLEMEFYVTNLPSSLSQHPGEKANVITVSGQAPVGSSGNGVSARVIVHEWTDVTNCYGRSMDEVTNLPVRVFERKLSEGTYTRSDGRIEYPDLDFTPPADLNSNGAEFASLELHLVGYNVASHTGGDLVSLQWAGGTQVFLITIDTPILELTNAPNACNHLNDVTIILPERHTEIGPIGMDLATLRVK